MDTPLLTELQRLIAGHEPRLRARLRQLVEIESPSDDRAAVNRGADLVTTWARELGGSADIEVLRHPGGSFGDVLELRFASPAPSANADPSPTQPVLILGHLDTVWPVGTLATMPWRELQAEDGLRLLGPGVVDMKAGVVMAFEAIAALLATLGHLPRPVTLLLNPDEEVGSHASRPHIERLARKSAAVFVLEPAQGLAYKTARKGVGHFELDVDGIAAHAGVDFGTGHSAVLEMTRLVQQISAWSDPALGRTINPGVISGGTRSNVVAAHCHAEIDVRVVTLDDAARVEALFRGLRPHDPACTLHISGSINRPPMERAPGTVALFQQARTLAAQLGLTLDEASTGGGSDGNFTAALGVPTLDGMGAVGGGAHATHEYVLARHLPIRTTLLAAMLAGPF